MRGGPEAASGLSSGLWSMVAGSSSWYLLPHTSCPAYRNDYETLVVLRWWKYVSRCYDCLMPLGINAFIFDKSRFRLEGQVQSTGSHERGSEIEAHKL